MTILCCLLLAGGEPLPLEPALWTTLGGTWRLDADGVSQSDLAAEGTWAWHTARAFGDVELTCEFTTADAGQGVRAAGLLFGWTDSRHGWYGHFDAKFQQVVLVRCTATEPWFELDRHRGVPLPMGVPHQARVVVAAGRIAVFLDGALVAAAREPAPVRGYVGLRAGQGAVRFTRPAVSGDPIDLEPFAMVANPDDLSGLPRIDPREDHLAVADGGGYFPVLVTLADGSLGAVVRGGAPHLGRAGRLDWIRSTDGGRTWSPPRVVVDSDWDDRNPAVGVMRDGTIVCAYGEAQSYNAAGEFDRAAGPYVPKFCLSHDAGATWSEARDIAPGVLTNGSPYGRIIVLDDGTALMPYYGWADDDGLDGGGRAGYLVRSTDGGRTWGDVTLALRGFNEFSVVQAADRRVVAALRDWDGALSVAESADGGRTFGEPRPVTRPSLHPADLIRLDGDLLLMVYGNRLTPKGVVGQLSLDGGRTWPEETRVLLAWDADSGDCGYPSVQRSGDRVAVIWYAVGTAQQAGAQARCIGFALGDLLRLAGVTR